MECLESSLFFVKLFVNDIKQVLVFDRIRGVLKVCPATCRVPTFFVGARWCAETFV